MWGWILSCIFTFFTYYLCCVDYRRRTFENVIYFAFLHVPPFVKDWMLRTVWFGRLGQKFIEEWFFDQRLAKWSHLEIETIPRNDEECPELLIIRPPNAKQEKLPVIYFIHGGGFVFGGAKSGMPLSIAQYLNAVVISVEYRLAPEHVFPAAAEDCINGMKWVWKNIEQFGDPMQFIVGGVSAGGQLTCVCAQAAVQLKIPLKFHFPIVPCLYPFVATPSAVEHSLLNEPILTIHRLAWFYAQYFGRNPRVDKRANIFNGSFKGLSPAVVCVARYDILRDDGEDYTKALKEAGVKASLEYLNGGHLTIWFLKSEEKKFLMKLKAYLNNLEMIGKDG